MNNARVPNKDRICILKKLVETPSPSGFEQQIQSIIREEISPYMDDVKIDVMGNLIGLRNGRGNPKIILMAHSDEVGLMVSHISEEGFLYFLPIGTVDDHILPGERVVIHSQNGPVFGVIGRKPIFLQNPEERTQVIPLKQQWIDIGSDNKEDAEQMVSIGDPVTFTAGFQKIENKDIIISNGLDDKLGVFVLIEVLRKLSEQGEHDAAVYIVSTVQEEIGLRGASPAAYHINAHAAFVIDIGFPSDSPDTFSEKQDLSDTRLGKGAILDRGSTNHPVLYQLLLSTAKKHNIPIQLRAAPTPIATDAKAVQLSRGGVATISINLPARYSQTPSAVASLRDVEYTSELLAQTICAIDSKIDFTP